MSESVLHPLIVRNLAQMGYAQPRPIQQAALQPILDQRDVIGLAQTGTGKTAAFMAPVLHQLLSRKPVEGRPIRAADRLRALVLCPTRELAQQVQREAGLIAQGTALRTACVFGKAAISPQVQAIERGVDLLVGTPGRVIELLDSGALLLTHARHVVIDEGDRMLDMGFLPQVKTILGRAGGLADHRADDDRPQIMLFSATMPPVMEDLARTFMREPVRIEIGKHTTPVAHVTQRLLPVADEHKVEALLHLLGAAGESGARGPGKAGRTRRGTLIFCRTRRRVGWVGGALERHGLRVGMIHGDRSQAQRQKALDRFHSGELHVLVATDVAARGLHIPAVKTVINYDLPMRPEEYVHRVGRAAHGFVDQAPETASDSDARDEREDPTGGADRRSSNARPTSSSRRGEAFTLLDPEDRLHWRAIVDATGIQVFAEHEIAGWAPPPPRRSQSRADEARQRRAAEARDDAGEASADTPVGRGRRKVTRRSKGRSHASAPIRKNQKPGAGVRRRS